MLETKEVVFRDRKYKIEIADRECASYITVTDDRGKRACTSTTSKLVTKEWKNKMIKHFIKELF